MRPVKFLFTAILLTATLSMCYAQRIDTKDVDRAIESLQQKWQSNLVFPSQDDTSNTQLFHTMMTYRIENPNDIGNHLNELNALKGELYHKDIGLGANMGYLENLDPAPDDDNLFYFRRIQAGLTWDILKGGFVGNRYKEKALLEETKLEQQALSREKKEDEYLSRFHSIMHMFNRMKTDILANRRNIVATQLAYAEEFHRLKLLKREDLIAIQGRLAEIDAMFNIYQTYNQQIAPDFPTTISYADNIPVFDINYSILLEDYRILAGDSSTQMSEEWLKYKTSAIHDIQLRAFARYNWYDLVNTAITNRSFFSMGLNVNIPIPFNNKLKKEIALKDFEYSQMKDYSTIEDTKKDLINDAYEYRYKLKQYISFYEKRMRFMELLRQENVLLKLDPVDFNPIKALGLIDDILKIDIELTDLNQNMYLKLLKIYTKLPNVRSREMVSDFKMPTTNRREENIDRRFYIWSSSLKKYNAEFIVEYLKYNDVESAVISINEDKSLDSLRKHLALELMVNNIEVHWMIGRNKTITNNDLPQFTQTVFAGMDSVSNGVHLDIEPHTFSDWKENKSNYLQKYHQILDEARKFCDKGNLMLSISVPLHYPDEDLMKMLQVSDEIYFMCYENVSESYLTRKLQAFSGQANKICIALRTDDFEQRVDMEQLFDALSSSTGITKFCLHDFDSLYELDKKSIKPYQTDEER